MEPVEMRHGRATSWGWKETLWRQASELENWIDDMALRLGDALFGVRRSEKLFGPHPGPKPVY
jgi:hypothetical protein